MQSPIIGITCNMFVQQAGNFPGVEKCSVNYDYIYAIQQVGGIPLLLPVIDPADIRVQMTAIDGLLLSGGFDVCSLFYRQEAQQGQGVIYPERDEYEIIATKIAYENNIPILGICRGIQVLNVAFGGTLVQDIPAGCLQHMQQSLHRSDSSHTIDITPSSKLFDIIGCQEILTNSFHHQAIHSLANNFIVSAVAKDGIVEAIEDPSREFVIGVQFHPETMRPENRVRNLFKQFVRFAYKQANKKVQG